ncbi:hypothetical protein P7K49_032379, partial [Saguinus oedipus]
TDLRAPRRPRAALRRVSEGRGRAPPAPSGGEGPAPRAAALQSAAAAPGCSQTSSP